MISVKNLKKSYDSFLALKGLSFNVHKGEIVALLGPNGAGKTTTMKIITGFMNATDGDVTVDNVSIDSYRLEIQQKIGYLPENTPLYHDLNVYEHLELAAEVHGITGVEVEKNMRNVVKACGLEKHLYHNISELSKGYKQRVALAQAIIHDPDFLILDEPTTGLDPNQIIEIRELIKTLGKKKTIILSTHIMQEVEAMADRVLVINQGELVAEGTPEELMKGTTDTHNIRVTVKGLQKTTIEVLEKVEGVQSVKKEENVEKGICVYSVAATDDVRSAINKALVKADLDILEIHIEKQSMEDVFHQLTKK